MGNALVGLGALLALFAVVCQVVITAAGFKRSALTGLFSIVCFPLFTLYFAFTGFQHPWKGTILAGWLGGLFLAVILFVVGRNMVAAAAATAQ
jgi:benzodiazapine receptor